MSTCRLGSPMSSSRIILNFLLALMLLFPLLIVGQSTAAGSVTVTSVDQDKGLVTVRDNGTGATTQIKIDSIETLKSFKVGEVLEKPAVLEVQPRSSQGPPTMSGKSAPGSCIERCMAAPGTTTSQCAYWCATR